MCQNKSLWSLILYTFFNDFINVYSPMAGADNPLGTKFWCQQKGLITLPICCMCQNKSLWSLILYTFFNNFIYVYSPITGADNPLGTQFWCQQQDLITLPICCMFQNKSLRNLILYTFLMILYMYIAPWQGQTTPWGQNFDVNRKALSLCPFIKGLKKISLNFNFILFCFHYFIHIYSPRAGAVKP